VQQEEKEGDRGKRRKGGERERRRRIIFNYRLNLKMNYFQSEKTSIKVFFRKIDIFYFYFYFYVIYYNAFLVIFLFSIIKFFYINGVIMVFSLASEDLFDCLLYV